MNTIAQLEKKLAVLRNQLSVCKDPDEKAELEEKIDYMQDEIDDIEAITWAAPSPIEDARGLR